MPSLIVQPKEQPTSTVKLDRLRMTIGRSIRSDVVLRDPFASRLHAVVQSDGGHVLLVDMGSANGTYVNEQQVRESRRLLPGDRIRIGDTRIQFLSEDKPPTSIPPVLLSGPEDGTLPESETVVTDAASRLLSSLHSAPLARPARGKPAAHAEKDLLGIISKVGVVLLPRTSLSETLRMTMQLVFEALPAERGFLFLRERGEVRCEIARSASGSLPSGTPARISRSIVGKVFKDGTSILSANATEDPRFKGHGSVQIGAIRSVMAVPLISGQETLGVIYVDNTLHNRFAETDLSVLATIAAVAAIKVEHEQFRAELLEKKRMEEELKVASEIQMRLLPIVAPKLEGWDLTGVSLPCREIGGDYYDFIPCKGGNLALSLGDVAGKGISAALLMSSVHAAVRAQSQACDSIAEVMTKVNQYIWENAPSNRFVTLFYGELNVSTGVLRYSNAGHNLPILVRQSGEVQRLDAGGLAVGILPNEKYDEGSVTLDVGDALVIFSDGLSEAVNASGQEFGERRIIQVVRQSPKLSASELRDRIEEALSQFVGAAPPVDDMTLMVVMRRDPTDRVSSP